MRVLITGATGLLGARLTPFLREAGFDVVTQGQNRPADLQLDLADGRTVERALEDAAPETVVHAAGLVSIEQCEADPDAAYRANVLATQNVAGWVRRRGARLVYISTDHLYDGCGPSGEEAVTIRNVYALSKYAGELAAQAANTLTLRTNFFGRSMTPGRSSFSDWVRARLRGSEPVTLFTDVYFSPLSLPTLCGLLMRLLGEPGPGVYNLGSRNGMSKRDFAHELARRFGLPLEHARDGQLAEQPSLVRRPLDMRMDCSRFERDFGVKLPELAEEIGKAEE